jgi:hypothetical protein
MSIKKLGCSLAVSIILFSSQSVLAQIHIGVKAGGNLYDNYQLGQKYFVSEPYAGFHAGVFGDYYFVPEKLHARVEALFSTRGLHLSEYVDGYHVDYERESSYVDFPVSANYKIWKNLKIHAGLVPSLFVQEYRSITRDASGLKVEEGDQFRSYERWQFGALAGASYGFKLFDKNFEAGARYCMAFTRSNELIRNVRASRDPRYMMVQLSITCAIFEF